MAELNDVKFMVVDSKTSFVTITAGQTVSSSFNSEACSLLGIYLPSNFTASNLTIQVAKFANVDPGYYVTVDGVVYTVPVSSGLFLPIPPYLTAACQRFRLITSVIQASTVKLELALAPLFSAV